MALRAAVVLALAAALAASAAPAGAAAPLARPLTAFAAGASEGDTHAERTASYRRLRAMGVRAIRLDFQWGELEPVGEPLHDYDWARQDAEVRAIRAAGLGIIGLLDYGHPDYSTAGGDAHRRGQKGTPPFNQGDPQLYPPDDPADFARFAADVATRYRTEVARWEVWNEENQGWRFWEPKEDPAAYGRLLCATKAALARADRGAPVALGGLFIPPLGDALGTGGVRFLDQVLTAGGAAVRRCFDAVAFHPYPYPFTSPEAVVAGRGSVIGVAADLRRVLRRHGIGATPLWNTEIGWPTVPRANGVTEARQARYAARTQLLSWARGIPVVTWYNRRDAADPSGVNQEAHFGFLRADGTPKPAYRALAALDDLLGAPAWRFAADRSRALRLPRGRRGVGEGFALEFRGAHGRRVLALWYANERPPAGTNPFARVEPGTPARTIRVRLSLPRGAVVRDVFGRRRRAARDLRVGQDPVYVSWRR